MLKILTLCRLLHAFDIWLLMPFMLLLYIFYNFYAIIYTCYYSGVFNFALLCKRPTPSHNHMTIHWYISLNIFIVIVTLITLMYLEFICDVMWGNHLTLKTKIMYQLFKHHFWNHLFSPLLCSVTFSPS